MSWQEPMQGRIEAIRVNSKALQNARVPTAFDREILVYLPPGYESSQRRYSTLYVLPAFAATHRSLFQDKLWEPNFVRIYEELLREERIEPSIVVSADSLSFFGGSQFVDSSWNGNHQSYLVDEVVPAVDMAFRTIPRAGARAFVGRSSGGFGALRVAIDRPDVADVFVSHAGDALFEASLRPLFTEVSIALTREPLNAFVERYGKTGPTSPSDFSVVWFLACCAAYAPRANESFPHLRLPFNLQSLELDLHEWNLFLQHDPVVRMKASREGAWTSKRFFLDAGDRDEHGLQLAASAMAHCMSALNVKHHHEIFAGTHRGTLHRYSISLPWISSQLDRA